MADEQIRIDITAEDDASKVLDKVADDAEKLEKLSPEIDVTADTDSAESALADVGDEAKKLEKLSPEVDVTADTSSAESALADVRSDAEALSRQDTEIILRARIDDAKGALKALRDDLDQTGEKAEDTAKKLDRIDGDGGGGISSRGNAIADLTGPLGEASSAASDFAGVFEGLGDIAGDVVGKLGGSAATVAKVGQAMGVLGLAVTVGAAAWTLYQGNQKKAREETERMVASQNKLNDALEKGDVLAWATEFKAAYGDAVKAAQGLGIAVSDATKFVTGQIDVLPGLNEGLARATVALRDAGLSEDDAAAAAAKLITTLNAQREAWGADHLEAGKAETTLTRIGNAMPGWAKNTDDLSGSVDELGAAQKETADWTDSATRANQRAATQAALTAQGFDKIRTALDMRSAADEFRAKLDDTLFWVRNGATLTKEHILDIKNGILNVAEYAGLTPIEVRSYLDRIDNGDVDRVVQEVNHRLEQNTAKAQVDLKPPTAQDYANMNETIKRGIGTIYLTAALNNLRSGVYG